MGTAPLHVSLFAQKYEAEYDSFNRLFKAAVTGFLKVRERRRAEQQRQAAIRDMKKRIARLRKSLLSPEDIENIRIKGELILASISRIKKGLD